MPIVRASQAPIPKKAYTHYYGGFNALTQGCDSNAWWQRLVR